MAIKESLLAEFDHEAATTRRLLERLPDNKLTWKPHEKSMTMGGLATHLANLPNWGSFILDQPFFDLEASPPSREALSSRSLILEEFDSTIAKARTAMNRSDAEYTALWTLKRGTQEIFTLPRLAALRSFVLSHIIHHRGQLSVYLRLNDVPVPPIYGPSADEG